MLRMCCVYKRCNGCGALQVIESNTTALWSLRNITCLGQVHHMGLMSAIGGRNSGNCKPSVTRESVNSVVCFTVPFVPGPCR